MVAMNVGLINSSQIYYLSCLLRTLQTVHDILHYMLILYINLATLSPVYCDLDTADIIYAILQCKAFFSLFIHSLFAFLSISALIWSRPYKPETRFRMIATEHTQHWMKLKLPLGY